MPTGVLFDVMLSPAAVYKRQQQNPRFSIPTAHQLDQGNTEHLVRSLGILIADPRVTARYSDPYASVPDVDLLLQSSLDYLTRGEIAVNLFQLYGILRVNRP